MNNIKFDKSVSYVFFTKDYLYISSDKISAQISYEKQNVLKISENVMAVLLRKEAEKLGFDTSKLVIVISDNYYNNRNSIKTLVKKDNNNQKQTRRIKNIFSADNESKIEVSKLSEFMYNGQYVNNYSALPLLQNYFECSNVMEKREPEYNNLISELKSNDIFPLAVIPFAEFAAVWTSRGKLGSDDNLKYVINISRTSSTIFVYNGLYLRSTQKINKGLNRIIEKISNKFNISYSNALILMKQYGFVFLPAKYVNFVIEIPVYDDIVISVELPELSYTLRESFRDLFSELFQLSGNDMPNSVGVFSSVEIQGVSQLAQLLLNAKPVELSFEKLNFNQMNEIANILLVEEVKAKKVIISIPIPEAVKVEVEQETSISLKEKISGLINLRIKPFLLEPEI